MLVKKMSIMLVLSLSVALVGCSDAEFSEIAPSSKLDSSSANEVSAEELDSVVDLEAEVIESEENDELVCKEDNKADRYIKICDKLRNADVESAGDISINNFKGITSRVVSSVDELNDSKGIMYLLGDQEDSAIKSVNNFGGILVACDMDIESINNSKGIIVVVEGDVAKVQDSNGILITYGGSIGESDNFKGIALERAKSEAITKQAAADSKACMKKENKLPELPKQNSGFEGFANFASTGAVAIGGNNGQRSVSGSIVIEGGSCPYITKSNNKRK